MDDHSAVPPETLNQPETLQSEPSPSGEQCGDSNQYSIDLWIWKALPKPTEMWINEGLEEGSEVDVALSVQRRKWIGERSFIIKGPLWRFRSDITKNLYVTYDHNGKITMEPSGPRSYFFVNIVHGSFTVQVPKTLQYIGIKNQKLALSTTPTKWSIEIQKWQGGSDPKEHIYAVISDNDSNKKWVSQWPLPSHPIKLLTDYGDSNKSQWRVQNYEDGSAKLYSRAAPHLYASCNVSKNRVMQESQIASTEDEMRIRSRERNNPFHLYNTREAVDRYLDSHGDEVAMGLSKKHGTLWWLRWADSNKAEDAVSPRSDHGQEIESESKTSDEEDAMLCKN